MKKFHNKGKVPPDTQPKEIAPPDIISRNTIVQVNCFVSFVCAESLIEKVTSGDSAGKKFRERDEKGFRELEMNE